MTEPDVALTDYGCSQDVEAFTLVDARGEVLRCSRSENAELFRLVLGGYGLLGIVATVRLRLAPQDRTCG